MDPALIILIIASFIVFGIGILAEKKRGLGFFSFILSTCSTMGILETRVDLGDLFLPILFPIVFVLLMSVVELIKSVE